MTTENDDDLNSQDSNQDGGGNDNVTLDDISTKLDRELDDFVSKTGVNRDQGRSQDRAGGSDQTQDQDQTTRTQRTRQGQNRNVQTDDGGQGSDQPIQRDSFAQPSRQYGTLFRTDQAGNVVDVNGRLVASVGRERRVFDRMYRHVAPIHDELAQTRTRLQTMEEANAAARSAGLNLEEQALGLRLVTAWKSDKLGTLRFLLRQAQESGIDVAPITQGGGLTSNEIRQVVQEILDDRLKRFDPFVENVQRDRELQEQRALAADTLSEFYEGNPNARLHSQHLAMMMESRGFTLDQAWAELRVAAATHGWDLNKDLQVQAQATLQKQGRLNPTGGRGNQTRLPDFNGRGNVEGTVRSRPRLANVEDSYDDIIAGALEDATRQVQ